ncbi:MAG TPA: D-tyrosyl-tRNA(Tyr) deacylase [Candidatus Onthocola stercoravium]|nr:D-tyrosyl-tRNA(Tyr) deacylase [Candidatus Onthocola stercoravium]
MKVVVQRSKYSKVEVDGKLVNAINSGLVLLVGFTQTDTEKEIVTMARKIANLRIFDDENGVMNKSILDVGGEILSISQFTLYGDATKGNRPSYIKALNGKEAIKLYELFNKELSKYVETKPGIFGADMQVSIHNDGPITIILEF